MIKKCTVIVVMLITIFSYGQNNATDKITVRDTSGYELTFQKNVSYAARKLKFIQELKTTGDSLILETENQPIRQIDILNDDYLETIDVYDTSGKVGLGNLPIGNYVVQAKIDRHWVVMYLEKKEAVLENKIIDVSDEIERITISKESSEETLFNKDMMYWVVYESNSQFSSGKTMGLKSVEEIEKMISKIELELKTEDGKNNKLFVYEVYDKSKFVRKQLRNRKYYQSKKSKHFNVSPLYSSEEKKIVVTQS
ncbi:hypothetical protein [Winogradskyella sp. SYSU M77433]|uniref:hypothetical protein n=1 Tax=Winogradskyella sp. SYSU M77433 TaxID=3042722 RepID=UPI002481464F|nr:hypothetical protein [Winogradskyella sp. SYSU M77433]MDH7911150.1 hypothetical protein [Winogradskyella sp. SYSU M77433]